MPVRCRIEHGGRDSKPTHRGWRLPVKTGRESRKTLTQKTELTISSVLRQLPPLVEKLSKRLGVDSEAASCFRGHCGFVRDHHGPFTSRYSGVATTCASRPKKSAAVRKITVRVLGGWHARAITSRLCESHRAARSPPWTPGALNPTQRRVPPTMSRVFALCRASARPPVRTAPLAASASQAW